jgi:copper chaperone NosL
MKKTSPHRDPSRDEPLSHHGPATMASRSVTGPIAGQPGRGARVHGRRTGRPIGAPVPPAGSPAGVRARAVAWPFALAVLVTLAAVAPARDASGALDQGRPACDYCRMIFTEPAFGGEVRTRSGRRLIYDSIECMAAAVLTDSIPQRDIRSITVVDHDPPHARLPLSRTTLVHSARIESPMGQGLFAVRDSTRVPASGDDPTAHRLDWRGVLEHVNRAWFGGKLSVESHASVGASPRKTPGERR